MTENHGIPAIAFDWPQSAPALLQQAELGGGMVRLILAGTANPRSWLIEHQVLPMLGDKQIQSLVFRITRQHTRSGTLVPLPDGSAFSCTPEGIWSALDQREALSEIQYIGFRYAPSDRWMDGFEAQLLVPGGAIITLTPFDVAGFWEKRTGCMPKGFGHGALDNIEAYGLKAIDKVFQTKGRLGL